MILLHTSCRGENMININIELLNVKEKKYYCIKIVQISKTTYN